jgi:thiol-disulfide isomerase/thioredoxin
MKRFMVVLIIIVSFLSVLVFLLRDKGQLYDTLNSLAVGELSAIEIFKEPSPTPQTKFTARSGEKLSFADFKGQVILVNFWATWCAPCIHEMPDLNRLQKVLGGSKFKVITMSLDRKGFEVIDPFFEKAGLDSLEAYLDLSNKLSLEVGATGLPTSILIDKKGKIIARVIGPLKWGSPQALEFISAAIEG